MAKEYEIKVHVDLSESDAALARQGQSVAKVEGQYQKAATTQEKQAKRGADAAFVSSLKLEGQAEKLSAKIAGEAKKAADAQLKEQAKAFNAAFVSSIKLEVQASKLSAKIEGEAKKASEAQIRENEKAFKASFVSSLKLGEQAEKLSAKIEGEAKKAADKKLDAEGRSQAKLTAMAGRSLSDEEVRAKAWGAVHQRLNDKRVDRATKAAEKERWAAMSVRAKFDEIGLSITDKINPGMLAFGAATAVVGVGVAAIVGHWKDVAKGIQNSIDFTTKYRESLPESAALKGHLGDTTKEVKESLLLRSKTLQTKDEAKDFESGMLNTGQASLGKRITQEEFDKLKVQAGSFQAAEQGNATTHGELVGRLPALMQLKKDQAGNEIPATADEVMGEEGRIFKTLSLGGSKFSSGSAQLLKHSSLTASGVFRSIGDQAAIQSMFSLNSPESAGDLTEQLSRATVGNLGRMRGAGVEGSEKAGEYLKGIGATNQDYGPDIAKKVSDDLAKQSKNMTGNAMDFNKEGLDKHVKAGGKAEDFFKSQRFNAYDYLRHHGFGNQEEINAILQTHASYQSGELKKFEDSGNTAPDAGPLQNDIAASRADPMMQARSADITSEVQKFTYDRSHATAEAFRRHAFEMLKSNPNSGISGDYEDVAKDTSQFKQNEVQKQANVLLQGYAEHVNKHPERFDHVEVAPLGDYNPLGKQIDIDKPYQEAIDKLQTAKFDPFYAARQQVTRQAVGNLTRASLAEAPGREGLAKRAQERRLEEMKKLPAAGIDPLGNQPAVGQIPAMIARPDNGLGFVAPAAPGFGTGSFDPKDPTRGLLERLLGLTEQQIEQQKEANRLLALAGRGQPTTPAPLPIMGPGRIPMRP